MTWILLLVLSLAWANDPLNNGIVIENITIDSPIIEPPTVDISNSKAKDSGGVEQKAKTSGADSKSESKDSALKTGSGSGSSSEPSAYLQPDQDIEDEDSDDSDEKEDSDEGSTDAAKKKDSSPR